MKTILHQLTATWKHSSSAI